MKTAFFYIIGADEIEPVKVGVATDLSARLASIQTGNPYKLSIKYSVKLPRNYALVLERSVLTYFSSNREVGEWLSVDWRILAEFSNSIDLAGHETTKEVVNTGSMSQQMILCLHDLGMSDLDISRCINYDRSAIWRLRIGERAQVTETVYRRLRDLLDQRKEATA